MAQERGKGEPFGVLEIMYAIFAIGILGSVVWAHHMFTVDIGADTRAYFTTTTIIIAVPTGIKIFRLLDTFHGVRFIMSLSLIWPFGFVFLFTVGLNRNCFIKLVIKCVLHDMCYVTAHFHYVLGIGAVFGLTGGLIN